MAARSVITFFLISVSWFCHAALPDGFIYLDQVDASIDQYVEFATEDNCVGQKLDGYEGTHVVCTKALAEALKTTQADLQKSNPEYVLRILDAYRPVRAVEHLKRWALDVNDTKTKAKYYPNLDKKDLAGAYVASGQSSHSRGSTVDIVIISQHTRQPLDFGPIVFGDEAHVDYTALTKVQKKNRLMLRALMLKHGFKPYDAEFWHFTLKNEPFPETYFDFTIDEEY